MNWSCCQLVVQNTPYYIHCIVLLYMYLYRDNTLHIQDDEVLFTKHPTRCWIPHLTLQVGLSPVRHFLKFQVYQTNCHHIALDLIWISFSATYLAFCFTESTVNNISLWIHCVSLCSWSPGDLTTKQISAQSLPQFHSSLRSLQSATPSQTRLPLIQAPSPQRCW